MSIGDSIGLSPPRLAIRYGTDIERLIVHRPLNRILSYIGRSIDDVVNDPIIKGQVRGYYKLNKQIDRHVEIIEMERAWNSMKMRF